MSAKTTAMLAEAAGTKLCDLVIIGVRPDASLLIDYSGSLSSFMLYLELAKAQAIEAWREAEKEYREKAA